MYHGMRQIDVLLRDRRDLSYRYLTDPPHGGIVIDAGDEVVEGDLVMLRITFAGDRADYRLRGAVLWCRDGKPRRVGVGFLSTEAEQRESLLSGHAINETGKLFAERRSDRYEIALKVTYETSSDFVIDYTRNISTGGLFVTSQKQPPVGTSILFKLFPPGQSEPIEIAGKVAWHRHGKGFGVRFCSGSHEMSEKLGQLVRRIAIDAPVSVRSPVFEEIGG